MGLNMKYSVFILFLSFLVVAAFPGFGTATEEEWIQNYFTQLKKSYDKRVAPEGGEGPGTPVNVSSSMYIIDIEKLDDSTMEFTALFYFRQMWRDPRLQFSDRLDPLVLRNADDIWTPDAFFVEERTGVLHKIIHPNIFCKIKPNGEVLYSIRLSMTFGCQMDLSRFPHDIQKCQINVESYGYNASRINFRWHYANFDPIGYSDNITMYNYDVIEVTPSTDKVSFSDVEYSRLEIHLKFKRKFGFFAIKMYIPNIFMVLAAIASFWIRPEERGLRLCLLLAVLYCMVAVCSDVQTYMPPAPYIKASDVWIGTCGWLIFGAFLEFIFIALIPGTDPSDGSKCNKDTLLSLESDAKEPQNSSSLRSPFTKLVKMFDARAGDDGRRNARADRIDRICRVIFPLFFVLFNIFYWSIYCC